MGQESFSVAGVDIGAATAKAVILRNKKILSFSVIPTGHSVTQAGESVLGKALDTGALSFEDLRCIISTGYGRNAVSFANKALTEIICHAAGVSSIMPRARTIIDIGGQDSKVIGLDESGHVSNFVMNDKCAAGTGRFLEVIAGVLDVNINDIGSVSLTSNEPCNISSTCTIFAESEVVGLIHAKTDKSDISKAIHDAMASRIVSMIRRVGVNEGVVMIGGVAKNPGLMELMKKELHVANLFIPDDPEFGAAVGAAVVAAEEA